MDWRCLVLILKRSAPVRLPPTIIPSPSDVPLKPLKITAWEWLSGWPLFSGIARADPAASIGSSVMPPAAERGNSQHLDPNGR